MSLAPRQQRIRIVTFVVGMLLLVIPLTTPLAGATTKHATSPPICRPGQLLPSMSPLKGTYSSSAGFRATLWFQNADGACTLFVDDVPVQAVSGPSRTPVGIGSLSGAVAYPSLVLAHGALAYASVSIGSISTAAFKKMMREHGSSCSPKYADGIEVVSNLKVRSDSWPSHYFALPEQVPVCTKDYFNITAGVIAKSPVGLIKGRLETNGGPSPSSGYRPYPGTVWATAGSGEPFGATVPTSGYFEFRVPVGTYQLTGASPMYGNGTYRCLGIHKLAVKANVTARENVICIEK